MVLVIIFALFVFMLALLCYLMLPYICSVNKDLYIADLGRRRGGGSRDASRAGAMGGHL